MAEILKSPFFFSEVCTRLYRQTAETWSDCEWREVCARLCDSLHCFCCFVVVVMVVVVLLLLLVWSCYLCKICKNLSCLFDHSSVSILCISHTCGSVLLLANVLALVNWTETLHKIVSRC